MSKLLHVPPGIAGSGISCNRFHNAAMCSPTRPAACAAERARTIGV